MNKNGRYARYCELCCATKHCYEKLQKEAVELGIEYLWFQPGSESPELENWLKNTNGIKYLINSCIMVDTL